MSDPFAAFGAEPRLLQDADALERKLYELNRLWHPDHAGEAAEAEARSAEINSAYRVLKDPLPRAKAWLALRGATMDSARGATPSAVAMRGFEVQEAIEGLKAGDGDARASLARLSDDVREDLASALERFASVASAEPLESPGADDPFVAEVAAVAAELSYLERQGAQIESALEDA